MCLACGCCDPPFTLWHVYVMWSDLVIVFLRFIKTLLLSHVNWPCRLHLHRSVLADVFPSVSIFPTTDLTQLPLSYPPSALQCGSRLANYSSCPVSAATSAWSADVPASRVPVSAAAPTTPIGTTSSDTCANHPCGHSPLPNWTSMFASQHPSAGTWIGPYWPQTHQCRQFLLAL